MRSDCVPLNMASLGKDINTAGRNFEKLTDIKLDIHYMAFNLFKGANKEVSSPTRCHLPT
jgi:hypothetical protein